MILSGRHVCKSYLKGRGGLLSPVDGFDPVRLVVVDGHHDLPDEVGFAAGLVTPRVFEDVKSRVFADDLEKSIRSESSEDWISDF